MPQKRQFQKFLSFRFVIIVKQLTQTFGRKSFDWFWLLKIFPSKWDPDWTQGKFHFKYGFWKIYDIFLHDYRYVALLGLAENFLKPSPNHPGYKVNPAGVLPAIKCLGAIFRLNPRPAPIIEARTVSTYWKTVANRIIYYLASKIWLWYKNYIYIYIYIILAFTTWSSSEERNPKCWFSQATFRTSSKIFLLLIFILNHLNFFNGLNTWFLVVPNSSSSRYGRRSSGILLSSSRSLLWGRSDTPIQTNTSRSNEKFSAIALLALSPFVSISSKFWKFD